MVTFIFFRALFLVLCSSTKSRICANSCLRKKKTIANAKISTETIYRETYRRKPKWGLYIFQAFAFLQEHDFLIFKLSQSLYTTILEKSFIRRIRFISTVVPVNKETCFSVFTFFFLDLLNRVVVVVIALVWKTWTTKPKIQIMAYDTTR